MSNTPTLDLELIKDRAGESINTAVFDGSVEEYEHAVQFVQDHRALIEEVERLRSEVEERRTESFRCTCYNNPD